MPTPTFAFEVTATDNTVTTFTVESFAGEERVSQPFEYRLTLRHPDPALDFSKVVNQAAVLTMEQEPHADATVVTTVPVKGIVASFRITRQFDDGDVECEAVLVPKLWRLRMSQGSQVFQELTTQEIVEAVLQTELEADDYEFRLTETYLAREFCMQYQESNLDFVQRLLEHEGIYYYYDDGLLVFSDSRTGEPEVAGLKQVTFGEATGAMTPADDQVYRFIYNEQVVPQKVAVKDYDFEAFASEKEVEQATDLAMSGGDYARVGTHHEHGRYAVDNRNWTGKKSDDSDTTDAANASSTSRDTQLTRVATVRAQEHEAQRQTVDAMATASRVQAGHVFELSGHFRFDGDYFVTAVRHTFDGTTYTNTFACLPASAQFRPPRRTPVPRVPGIMTAKVKGTGADEPAYLDDEGRYRVRFPFDPNAAAGSEPSRPIRLAQPYAGEDYGIHFPNRANAEMVFACLDGDPDRPLGLSVVPNPWKHAPVPSTKNKLTSQNPITKGPKDAITFDEKKNVIKTHVGHQIVMDDGDGTGNVGITLQTGKSENSAGRNVYWGSKLELGGYREKSTLEIVLDSASHVAGWLNAGFTRDYPGLAGQLAGLIASQVITDNYLDDTYGTTTPVGANLFSKKDVTLHGKDGVNILSPNLFGMFSNDLIVGPDSDDPRSYLEAITKFVMNTIWQDVMNDAADEVLEAQEKMDTYSAAGGANKKKKAALAFKLKLKKRRTSDLIFTLLQRSGVNISSAGELKMASVQATNIAAGQGGFSVKSYGTIEQKADLSVALESHEGIKLSTKGKPYEGDGVIAAVRKLGGKFPSLGALLAKLPSQQRVSLPFEPAAEDKFPILLENEEGNILLNTGPGDVMAHADKGGSVKAFADEGQVHLWSNGKAGGTEGIYLEVGNRQEDDTDKLAKEEAKGVLWINNDEIQGFSAKKVQLYVGADYTKKTDSAITIEAGQIELKCGQSSILMKKNGDITIKGKKIVQQATTDVSIEGNNITSKAKMTNKIEGLDVKAKASLGADFEGALTNLKGQMTSVKGSMVKVGS